MGKVTFDSPLVEGHKGVTVVLVPFDPEVVWERKPWRLDPRRDGWVISGTANGVKFDGYVGQRWGRFFIIIEPSLRAAARLAVGDTVTMSVAPTTSSQALARAREQAKVTTTPKKGRADAIDPPAERPPRKEKAMPRPVDFEDVSTDGLESSPVVAALAGLRANEARYF
jgi:hypothetical protein